MWRWILAPGGWRDLCQPHLCRPWSCCRDLGCSNLWVRPCPPSFQSGGDPATSGTGTLQMCWGCGPAIKGLLCQVVTSHPPGPGRSECQVPAQGFCNKGGPVPHLARVSGSSSCCPYCL